MAGKDDFDFEIEGEEREVTPVQKPDNVAPQQEAAFNGGFFVLAQLEADQFRGGYAFIGDRLENRHRVALMGPR